MKTISSEYTILKDRNRYHYTSVLLPGQDKQDTIGVHVRV